MSRDTDLDDTDEATWPAWQPEGEAVFLPEVTEKDMDDYVSQLVYEGIIPSHAWQYARWWRDDVQKWNQQHER